MAAAPNLVVLAGPNDAGKSTAAPFLLQGVLKIDEFVNADEIARGLSAFHPEDVALTAGRIVLGRMRSLASQSKDFVFETTLASKTLAPWIARLRDNGYAFHLLFLWLSDVEIAIRRV